MEIVRVEKTERPSLFCLNGISHEEKLENLLLLLSDDDGMQLSQ